MTDRRALAQAQGVDPLDDLAQRLPHEASSSRWLSIEKRTPASPVAGGESSKAWNDLRWKKGSPLRLESQLGTSSGAVAEPKAWLRREGAGLHRYGLE